LSSSALRLQPTQGNHAWQGRITVPIRDLADLIPLDANGDSEITWGELQAAEGPLQTLLHTHLTIRTGQAPQPLHFEGVEVDTLAGETCASWGFSTLGTPPSSSITVHYTLLFDVDPDHRCLVRCAAETASDSPATDVLSPQHTSATFMTGGGPSPPPPMTTWIAEGVHHIWIGFDHILFLLALLLPSVLRRTGKPEATPTRFGPVAVQVARVVTAFTVAHSITLGLAAFEVVRLPSRWVETAIAASVAVAALNNLIPFLRDRTWQVAFGFGLIHGFGFAGVLADLDLPRSGFARGLLGFNLGVEVGQLAIVAAFLPVAYVLRHSWFYRRIALQGGSLAITGVATLWTLQRAFEG